MICMRSFPSYSQSNRIIVIQPYETDDLDLTLNSVYGIGNYEKHYYYDFGLPLFDFIPIDSTICTILLIEDPGASSQFNAFYNFYKSTIEDWVADGGHLLINTAYIEDGNFEIGFGDVNFITTNYTFCSDASCFEIADTTHLIFNGPSLPAYSPIYDFSFTHIQGPGLDTLLVDTIRQHVILSEKFWGLGVVIFAAGINLAQTPSYYLGANIFSYLSPCLKPPIDIGVQIILTPDTQCSYSETEAIEIAVRNYGLLDQTSFQIAYSIDGGDPTIELITDTLKAGFAKNYTFTLTANLSEGVSHNISAWSNILGDINFINDTTSKQITRLLPATTIGFPNVLCANVEEYIANPEYPTGIWSGEGVSDSLNGIINTSLLTPGESTIISYQYSVPIAYLQETIPYGLRDSISPNYLYFDDIGSTKVDIGFTFKYFGNTYDSIYIGANGILTFDSGYNFGLPDFIEATNNSIAVCEGDLHQQAGGKLYFETQGTAPNREFVVSYDEIPFWFPPTEHVNVQCILHENSSQIEFQIESIDINTYGSHFVLQGICNSDLSQKYYTTSTDDPWSYSIYDTAFIFNPITCDTIISQSIYLMPDYEFNLPSDTVSCNLDGILLEIPNGDYGFNWSNGDSTNLTNILEPGMIWVTATDSACLYSDSIYVFMESPPLVEVETVASLPDYPTGLATAVVTGGTYPYEYLWNDGQTTATISSLAPGTYTVTIFDSLGCTSEASGTVDIIDSAIDTNELFSIYPNPANSIVHLKVTSEMIGALAYFYSADESLCMKKTLKEIDNTIVINDFPAGIYTVTLVSNKVKTSLKFVKQ